MTLRTEAEEGEAARSPDPEPPVARRAARKRRHDEVRVADLFKIYVYILYFAYGRIYRRTFLFSEHCVFVAVLNVRATKSN